MIKFYSPAFCKAIVQRYRHNNNTRQLYKVVRRKSNPSVQCLSQKNFDMWTRGAKEQTANTAICGRSTLIPLYYLLCLTSSICNLCCSITNSARPLLQLQSLKTKKRVRIKINLSLSESLRLFSMKTCSNQEMSLKTVSLCC